MTEASATPATSLGHRTMQSRSCRAAAVGTNEKRRPAFAEPPFVESGRGYFLRLLQKAMAFVCWASCDAVVEHLNCLSPMVR